jgi:hypothetical protein
MAQRGALFGDDSQAGHYVSCKSARPGLSLRASFLFRIPPDPDKQVIRVAR